MQTAVSSPPFVEGLVYSQQRGGDKRNVFGSLARLTQELGAELCGRLSQIVLQGQCQSSSTPQATASHRSCSPMSGSRASPFFMAEVQRDLSAHYGSHALRRGFAKPFGPCVHPVLRKGKLTVARAGVHGPRYMRLWRLHRARRCWCLRCGVWLTRGSELMGNHKGAKKDVKRVLATLAECRVRQHPRRDRRRTSRKSAPSQKFTLCCTRCLRQMHQAAARTATKQLSKETFVPPEDHAVSQRDARAFAEKVKSAVRKRQQKAEDAVAAAVAASRVPKRNRRYHRRSARRPRKDKTTTSVKQTKSLSTTTTAATRGAATTSAHVQQTLNAALKTQRATVTKVTTTAAEETAVTKQGVSAAKSTPLNESPLVHVAQKSLERLVPYGPLKKFKSDHRFGDKAHPPVRYELATKDASSPVLPVKVSTPLPEASEHRAPETKEENHAHLPVKVTAGTPLLYDKKAIDSNKRTTKSAATSERLPEQSSSFKKLRVAETSSSAAASFSSPFLGSKPAPGKPPKTAAVAAVPPLVPIPKGPPVKATPKKPVKAQANASGKAKLIDAMNQLGF